MNCSQSIANAGFEGGGDRGGICTGTTGAAGRTVGSILGGSPGDNRRTGHGDDRLRLWRHGLRFLTLLQQVLDGGWLRG